MVRSSTRRRQPRALASYWCTPLLAPKIFFFAGELRRLPRAVTWSSPADLLGDPLGKGWDPTFAAPRRQVYIDDRPLLARRTHAALSSLAALPMVDARRLAAVGYCFGGRAVVDLIKLKPHGLQGVVSFHGVVDDEFSPDVVAGHPRRMLHAPSCATPTPTPLCLEPASMLASLRLATSASCGSSRCSVVMQSTVPPTPRGQSTHEASSAMTQLRSALRGQPRRPSSLMCLGRDMNGVDLETEINALARTQPFHSSSARRLSLLELAEGTVVGRSVEAMTAAVLLTAVGRAGHDGRHSRSSRDGGQKDAARQGEANQRRVPGNDRHPVHSCVRKWTEVLGEVPAPQPELAQIHVPGEITLHRPTTDDDDRDTRRYSCTGCVVHACVHERRAIRPADPRPHADIYAQ